MSDNSPRPRPQRLTTVEEVCREYLARDPTSLRATRHEQGSRGARDRRLVILKFVAAYGPVAVADLIPDDLEKWIEDHSSWVSNWTKVRVASSVKRAFNWAWNKGLIMGNPLKGVSFRPGARRKPLSEEHYRLILRNVSAEYRRVLMFLWWTGCRPCEMSALKWQFIDVGRSVAILHEHKTARSRQDGAPRTICLPVKALRLLTWILDDQRSDQEYVFLNAEGQPWKASTLSIRLSRLGQHLGLPAGVLQLYGCRHSFGTRMILAGVDLKTVSTLLGHTTTKMAEHYVHVAGETKHLLDQLEKGLEKKKGTP